MKIKFKLGANKYFSLRNGTKLRTDSDGCIDVAENVGLDLLKTPLWTAAKGTKLPPKKKKKVAPKPAPLPPPDLERVDKMWTKQEMIDYALEIGIDLDASMLKKDMIKKINKAVG